MVIYLHLRSCGSSKVSAAAFPRTRGKGSLAGSVRPGAVLAEGEQEGRAGRRASQAVSTARGSPVSACSCSPEPLGGGRGHSVLRSRFGTQVFTALDKLPVSLSLSLRDRDPFLTPLPATSHRT